MSNRTKIETIPFNVAYPVPTAQMSNAELLREADRLENAIEFEGDEPVGHGNDATRYRFVRRELRKRAANHQL